MPIGAKVTLRGDKMWEFLDRLFNVALPRVRDFQGINPNSFRRPRQLCPGHQGAADLPRDRVRQDRQDPRHGHHHLSPPLRPTKKAAHAAGAGWRSLRPLRRRDSNGKDFYDAQAGRLLPSSPPASTTAASCAAVPTPICGTTASAVSASVSWLTRARSPACVRLLSKKMKMAQQKDLTN